MGARGSRPVRRSGGDHGLIAPGFEGEQRELYVSLFRVMLVTPILFAASLTLGQVLLAEQRFFWYGLAPLLYNAGIILGTLVFTGLGIFGPAIGAVIGAVLHLASRFIGLRSSRFRIGLGGSFRTASVREFLRLMLPKVLSHPVEPITFLYFTSRGHHACGRQRHGGELRAQLPERAGQRHRRGVRTGRISRAVDCARHGRPTWLPSRAAHEPDQHRSHHDRRGDRPHRVRRAGDRDPARWRPLRRGGRRAHGLGAGRLRDLDPVREPDAPAQPGDLRHAAHAAAGARLTGRAGRSR